MTNETDHIIAERYYIITQKFTKYAGIGLYIICVFGTVMNVLTFSQKTYNRRATSLYLLFASLFDLAHLSPGTLSNILQYGFYYDWTINSVIYCKLKNYFVYVFTITSGTFTVFASIDRFLLSSHDPRRWNYSCRSVSKRCIKFIIIFWFIFSIPIIYCSKHVSYASNVICSNPSKTKFCFFVRIIYSCLLDGFLPPFIMMIFGLITCYNIRHLRRSSNTRSRKSRIIHQQMSVMLILQATKSTITSFPISIFNTYRLITIETNKTLLHQAKEHLVMQIVYLLFWSNYTSFFVYIYSSDVFRNQWIQLMKNFLHCCYGNERYHYSQQIKLERLETIQNLQGEKLITKRSSM